MINVLDHLTSFALLLSGTNNNNGCDGSGNDYIITWISLGFVGLALITMFLAIIIIELKYRKEHIENRKTMDKIEGRLQVMQQSE